MTLILPLTKGHPFNKDNYLAEGMSLLKGDYRMIHSGIGISLQ